MRDEAYDHMDPYGDGTYGTNYTPASTELERDQHKEFSRQQRIVYNYTSRMGVYGITGKEIQGYLGWETNAISRSMSNLLRDGKLVRLKARRGRAHIHVAPQWVEGRETLPYESTSTKNRLAALRQARDTVAGSHSYAEALVALDELIALEES